MAGTAAAFARDLSPALPQGLARMAEGSYGGGDRSYVSGDVPPQTFREYDPEWARSFWTSCCRMMAMKCGDA